MENVDVALYIYEEQTKLIKKEIKQIKQQQYCPMKIEYYTIQHLNIPISRKVNSIKDKFSKVLSFIDYIKYLRLSDCCTGNIPIPTTSQRLISICGSQKNVSNLIKFMKQLNLIKDFNSTYTFNNKNKNKNKSKTYYYYIEVEKEILQYCKENNINTYIPKNVKTDIYQILYGNELDIDNFDISQVRFSSKLHLLKPDNFSTLQFENFLTCLLYKNYPLLSYYQQLADIINKKYYKKCSEMSLRFVPTFTWNHGNKSIRKIGIRCTNTLVNSKNEKNNDGTFLGIYKEDILKKYDLVLHKDVKSSIPRITLSLNKGKWISEDIDIYKMIFDEFKQDENISFKKEYRDMIKALHMRCYFDTDTTICKNIIRSMYSCNNKQEVSTVIKVLKEVVKDVEGGALYDNEIFFYESCIYIDVLYELLQKGFFVWNCYDCFYARKKGVSQEQFEIYVKDLVEDKANQYIKKLNNNNNNNNNNNKF